MKNLFNRIIAIALIAVLAAAFAACTGAGKPDPTEAPTEVPTEAPTEEPTAEPTEVPTEEPTVEPTEAVEATAEELVAKYVEAVKPQMDAVMQTQDMLDFDCFAEGKTMILVYKYKTAVEVDPAAISSALDAQKEVYVQMYNELSSYAHDEDVSIIIRYLTVNDENILDYVVDKEYAAN